MEALRSSGSEPASVPGAGGRLKATLLLTDGQPNVLPPRGHLAELRDYKDLGGLPGLGTASQRK
eukprot:10629683-Alexandrium_andersonii.AAC.1